ncbi:hypothetical protein MHPYR_270091 [uncultured Mycobacterium sp.]|uniref:Uncharacterized protein n=1 Tax=uncultured Mycobacterium sp. TaxID=171292 RepID=A0A1Y5PED9_9MYCO|nr:hypothetical protein MHPYR_270091 [uncultured Mycobacterium sp.]
MVKVKLYLPFASNPGEWNEPSLATTVWGSSSLLVHVTVSPTFTVRLAGANAKLVMSTAVPATGGVVDVVADAIGPMPGIPDVIPGIPTDVPPFGPKSTVGAGAFAGAEHAATPTATATQANAVREWCMKSASSAEPSPRRGPSHQEVGAAVTPTAV